MNNRIKPTHVPERTYSNELFRVPVGALWNSRVQETNQYLWIFTDTTDGYVEIVTIENHQKMDEISSGYDEVVFQKSDEDPFERNYKVVSVEHWDVNKAITQLKKLKPETDFAKDAVELHRYIPNEDEPVPTGIVARVGTSDEATCVADGIVELVVDKSGRFFNHDTTYQLAMKGIHVEAGEYDSFGFLTVIVYWNDVNGNTFAIIGG